MSEELDIEFRTCPRCNGYGVLDSGKNCTECGGRRRGGLRSGGIGSGEIMYDKKTGRRISTDDLVKLSKSKADAGRAE